MNNKFKNILITGGAGFIGSALVKKLVMKKFNIINIDKLSYASDLNNLKKIENLKNYKFIKLDISNFKKLKNIFDQYQPKYVINCAAESHVDRSIENSKDFIESNIIGTYNLLECVKLGLQSKKLYKKDKFKLFHQVSTDEVFGDSERSKVPPDEKTPYNPSSPYSATKASSDHLVTSWGRTFQIPFTISICTNNYGPFQFPEKLIPVIILNSLKGKNIPIYGDGKQIRDWLYVDDHADALFKVVINGRVGETYNIGGHNEKTNLEVVNTLCTILDKLKPPKNISVNSYSDLIEFVFDRPGHDKRYAIDASKIQKELKWVPQESFESGMEKTVKWYLDNNIWISNIIDGTYKTNRLGSSIQKKT